MAYYLDAGEIEIANAAGIFSATATINRDDTIDLAFYDVDECRSSAYLLDASPTDLRSIAAMLSRAADMAETRRANARQLVLIQGGMAA